jgi:hypothetical protein
MLGLPDIAVGAVSAALIAGLVSLLGLIVSKEQKVSEFRQAWIDALRAELSSLIAHANAIHGANMAGFANSSEAWKVVRADFVGINEAAARIRLRLNSKESEAVAVLSQLERLEQLLAPETTKIDYLQLNTAEKELVSVAQVVLKQEWLRVRRGEQVFRVARFAALCVCAACVIALIIFSVARFADFMSSNNQIQKTGASVAYHADSALPASDLERWTEPREMATAGVYAAFI